MISRGICMDGWVYRVRTCFWCPNMLLKMDVNSTWLRGNPKLIRPVPNKNLIEGKKVMYQTNRRREIQIIVICPIRSYLHRGGLLFKSMIMANPMICKTSVALRIAPSLSHLEVKFKLKKAIMLTKEITTHLYRFDIIEKREEKIEREMRRIESIWFWKLYLQYGIF